MEYTNPFTGATISPSQVGYNALTLSVDTTLEWPINGNASDNVAANIVEVDATTTGLALLMPPASQVSTGQAVIISNVSANTFTVEDNSGYTLASVDSGVSIYLYITDNTTVNGLWASVTFGAGTSAADAAALAGYGLIPLGHTLNQAYPVINYYSNAFLDSTDRAQFTVWDGGAGTITLPSASSVGNNWFTMIRNNGTGILNIVPTGSDLIDGNSSTQLQLTESFVIVSNGTGWNTFGYGQATQFAFTILSLVVTGGTTTLSAAQSSNLIQEYSGTLTSNQVIILPPTVQLYSLNNETSGSYSLTFKTTSVGAQTVAVPQGSTLLVICDGTNVYNASSAASSSINSLTLGNGSLATPSLKFTGDITSGLFLPSSGQLGFVISNALGAYLNSSGLTVSGGGTFSGAVSGTTGTFTGAVSGTTGTFTGGISGGSI